MVRSDVATASSPSRNEVENVLVHDGEDVAARWAGMKPNVSRWRSAILGNDEFRFVFTAQDNGTITGSCVRKGGLTVLVR